MFLHIFRSHMGGIGDLCRELWDQAEVFEAQLWHLTVPCPWESYFTCGVLVSSYNRQDVVKPLQDCSENKIIYVKCLGMVEITQILFSSFPPLP